MPADRGRYPLASPRALDEAKRWYCVLAQGPKLNDIARPLHPKDWNDAQQIIQKSIQRSIEALGATGVMDPERLGFRPVAVTANLPGFYGLNMSSADPLAASPFYAVNGYLARTDSDGGGFVWNSDNDTHVDGVHRKCTEYDDSGVITDTTARYAVNALTGRIVYVRLNEETWEGPFEVASNTTSTITLQFTGEEGDPTNFPGHGTAGSQVSDGNAYRIDPVTPSGGDRTDTAWLDVWLEEISAEAVDGVDPFVDGSLNINFGGTTIEPTRRLQLRQAVFVEEGTDGSNYVDATGSLTALANQNGVYRYTDASGVTHYITKICAYHRYDGVADVTLQEIDDLRSLAGYARTQSIEEATGPGIGPGVLSGLGGSRSSNTYTVASGSCVINGQKFNFLGASATGPTGSAAGWAADTRYWSWIDASAMTLKIGTSGYDATEDVMLDTFKTSGTSLQAFTAGATYENLRRYSTSVASLFRPDANSRLRAYISMQSFDLAGTGFGGVGIDFYNHAGTLKASLDFTEADGGSNIDAVTLLGAASYAARVEGGGGGYLQMNGSAETGTLKAEGGMTFKGAGTAWDATGVNGVDTWKFKDTEMEAIQVTGGFTFGTPAGGVTPVGKTLFIPASEGKEQLPGGFNTTLDDGATYGKTFIGDWWQVFPTLSFRFNPDFKLSGSAYGRDKNSMQHAFLVIPLRIPIGWAVGDVTLRIKQENADGTTSIPLRFRIAYRDSFSSTSQDGFIGDATVTVDDSQPDFYSLIDASVLAPNTHPRLYACVFLDAAAAGPASGKLIIQGVEAEVTYNGLGDYLLDPNMAQVIEGLEAAP